MRWPFSELVFCHCGLRSWNIDANWSQSGIILQNTRKSKLDLSFFHYSYPFLSWTHHWGHHCAAEHIATHTATHSHVVNSYLWTCFLITVNVNMAPDFKRCLARSLFNEHTWLPSRQNMGKITQPTPSGLISLLVEVEVVYDTAADSV